MNTHTKRMRSRAASLADVGEFGWLERLGRLLGKAGKGVIVGYGDDAACLALPKTGADQLILLTADILVESVHFTWLTATPASLGAKAVAVNLSDIAAMGGRPLAMLVAIGAPPGFPLARLEVVFRAMASACRRWGVEFVGGDTVRSGSEFILSPLLVGEFNGPTSRLPLRSRLREGQHVYVTGTLGDSAAGLTLLLEEKSNQCGALSQSHRRRLIMRHRFPQPRLDEGRLLTDNLDDVAIIDLSDDLCASVNQLSRASGVGIEIHLNRLPISPALRQFCRLTKRSAIEAAVCGGEDYELLFATSVAPPTARRLFDKAGLATSVQPIGRVCGRQVRWLDSAGRHVKKKWQPFEHFV